MKFNEDSRVKIPAILHLTRLGYTYLSLNGLEWDASSNIVPSLFFQSVSAINPSATSSEIEASLALLDLHLDNEDYFHTLSLMSYLRAKSRGSVFDSSVINDLNFTPAVVPGRGQLEAFNKISEPMFKTTLNYQQQNQEPTQLRDWLLPILMNGQVTVGTSEG